MSNLSSGPASAVYAGFKAGVAAQTGTGPQQGKGAPVSQGGSQGPTVKSGSPVKQAQQAPKTTPVKQAQQAPKMTPAQQSHQSKRNRQHKLGGGIDVNAAIAAQDQKLLAMMALLTKMAQASVPQSAPVPQVAAQASVPQSAPVPQVAAQASVPQSAPVPQVATQASVPQSAPVPQVAAQASVPQSAPVPRVAAQAQVAAYNSMYVPQHTVFANACVGDSDFAVRLDANLRVNGCGDITIAEYNTAVKAAYDKKMQLATLRRHYAIRAQDESYNNSHLVKLIALRHEEAMACECRVAELTEALKKFHSR